LFSRSGGAGQRRRGSGVDYGRAPGVMRGRPGAAVFNGFFFNGFNGRPIPGARRDRIEASSRALRPALFPSGPDNPSSRMPDKAAAADSAAPPISSRR